MDLAKLRREHAQLVTIVQRLGEMIAADSPPAVWTELNALRRELASTLIGHLKAEDWMLYPRLLDSPDPEVAETARAFSDEMGGLAAAFMNYAEKWGPIAIESDWPGYRRDTAAIAQPLMQRITRENQELYPLLERLDGAA
ncbi:MAG: hemerythrin domain-containing protein [Novosphingobium sp.]|nr:hemerythrin domain-containing protein [Novosphingobium sp.]